MSIITDRIGQHEVLLTINQNYDKNLERNSIIWLYVFIKTQQLTK